MVINDPTSLLKNARFGENFEAKTGLILKIKRVHKRENPLVDWIFGGGCRIRTRVDITALMVFKTTPL